MAEKKKKTKEKIKKKTTIKHKTFNNLEGKFLLVKVGSELDPASTGQIEEIQDKIVKLFEINNINCVAFVTHHLVNMEIIENKNVGIEKDKKE